MSRFPQALRAIVFVVIAVSAAVALALDDRANSVRSLVIELAGASFSESRPGPALTAQMPELLWPPQEQTAPRSVLGPSTLIDPTGDGGFESGLGTWTAVNGTSSNRWFIGTAAGASSGGSAAFIGSSASTYTDGVAQAGSSAVFLYKDITFPAGETLITLTYDYKQPTLDGTFDLTRVFLVPTTTTLTPGSQLSSGQISLDSQGQGGQASFGSRTVTIPPSAAGTTQRLVFQWKNDATSPYGSAAIDSVSLVSNVPTVYT